MGRRFHHGAAGAHARVGSCRWEISTPRKIGLRPDYVLFIRKNIPIAVVEAKAEYKHPAEGLQQAMQYAEMMGVKFAYSSNGKGIVEHDFTTGQERDIQQFPSPDELWDRWSGVLRLDRAKRCRGCADGLL